MTQVPAKLPDGARLIRSQRGRWRAWLLTLLLRVLIKWRLDGRVDVARLRRQQLDAERHLARRRKGDVLRETVDFNGVPTLSLTPPGASRTRVWLHLHGGAFVARSPRLHADMLAPWAQRLGLPVLMPDYRLAPEHVYPAGLDDCHQVWKRLRQLGYAAEQIVLSGDSAGGNLALALMQRLKAEGEALPVCAVLLSPFVDFTLSSPSLVTEARRDPMFTPEFVLDLRARYLQPQQMLEPTASPLFGDFSDLPPLLIQVGELEMLRDEALRTAAAARAAGVSVELQVWAGLPHVFQAFRILPQAREAGVQITDFIVRQSGWVPSPADSIR